MLKNIIAACCTPKMIPVADSELSPVHFLIDSLIEKFKRYKKKRGIVNVSAHFGVHG